MGTKTDITPTRAQLFENPSLKDGVSRGPRSNRAAEVSQTIQKRGWAFLRVSGKSMFPWIREGDVVFLRRAQMLEAVRGDVVLFEKNGVLCVHRVLAVRGTAEQDGHHISLITKGDATEDADSPVSVRNLLGKVEFIYRRDKEIPLANGWRKHFGKALAILSPAAGWFKGLLLGSSVDSLQRGSCPQLYIDAQRSSENSAD